VAVQGISVRQRELGFAVLLALLALVRASVFGAAFPLFHHVDEPEHIDLIHKLARGHLPEHEGERIDADLADQIALLRSPEYLADEAALAEASTPLWERSPARAAADLERVARAISLRPNHELTSPPLFYGAAALWLAGERGIGMSEASALYGLRLLSALGLCALVVGSYLFCATLFPERRAMRLGVPMLLAFFPQDLFFSVSPDAWAPVLGLLLLALLWRWRFVDPAKSAESAEPSFPLSMALGLAMAGLFLTKLSNLPAVGVALAVVAGSVWPLRHEGERGTGQANRALLARAACVALFAALPVALWLGRNWVLFGSLTGTAAKLEALTWTARSPLPLADFLSHPLFSFSGLFAFAHELSATFWRGELYWHGTRLALGWVDDLFGVCGLLFLASAALRPVANADPARAVLRWSWALLAGSLLLLVGLSLAFDFGSSRFPSRAHPYFSSGRLIAAALFPFALLLVEGIDGWLGKRWPAWGTLIAVGLLSLLALGSELWLTWPVFGSPYNYFALPASLR